MWLGDWATIEHSNNIPPWDNHWTVAICSGSCSSSRDAKQIVDWFVSGYCHRNNIYANTVAGVAVEYIVESQ